MPVKGIKPAGGAMEINWSGYRESNSITRAWKAQGAPYTYPLVPYGALIPGTKPLAEALGSLYTFKVVLLLITAK